MKTLSYGNSDPGGILRTSCSFSPSFSTFQICDSLPLSGLQFPHLKNKELETQFGGPLPAPSFTMLSDLSSDPGLVWSTHVSRALGSLLLNSSERKWRQVGHPGPVSSKSMEAWGDEKLWPHCAVPVDGPCRSLLVSRTCAWGTVSTRAFFMTLSKLLPRWLRVGVFFLSPLQGPKFNLNVTLADEIFGNTLFKSNLRQD